MSDVLDRISYWHPLDVNFEAYVQENLMWMTTEDDKGQCVWLDRFEYPRLYYYNLFGRSEEEQALARHLAEPDIRQDAVRFFVDTGPREARHLPELYIVPCAAPLGDPALVKRLTFTLWKKALWQYWDIVEGRGPWDKRILDEWYALCLSGYQSLKGDLAYVLEEHERLRVYGAIPDCWGDLSTYHVLYP